MSANPLTTATLQLVCCMWGNKPRVTALVEEVFDACRITGPKLYLVE
jgi:hypothetical protein